MERLTKRINVDGFCEIADVEEQDLDDALERLADYEDTGYMPEEIEDLRAENQSLKADCATMWEAMDEFCARVEKGEIRSRRTYAKFMEILHATIQYKALNQHK